MNMLHVLVKKVNNTQNKNKLKKLLTIITKTYKISASTLKRI